MEHLILGIVLVSVQRLVVVTVEQEEVVIVLSPVTVKVEVDAVVDVLVYGMMVEDV